MRLMKWIGYAFLCVAGLVVVAVALGAFVDEQHTVSVAVDVPASQQRVWQLIVDVDAQPKWRTGLVAVEHVPDQSGHPCWVEVQKHTRMPLCVDVSSAPATRIVRIADPNLPFGGTWVYQIAATGQNASRLTITENGTVGPALWRFISHYVMKDDAAIRQYEADLLKAVKQ